jgi:uncharacterized SAM-binding protein YcdF (DUF218 family)
MTITFLHFFKIFFDFLCFFWIFYIQDVGISAKGLRPKRCCFAKKPLKSPQKDSAGLSVAAKGLRIWKIMMEVILASGFGFFGWYFTLRKPGIYNISCAGVKRQSVSGVF